MLGFIIAFCATIFFGTIITLVLVSIRNAKKMQEKAEAVGAKIMITARHVDGLGIGNGTPCDIYLFDDRIAIQPAIGANYELPTPRIRAAVFKDEQELVEKGKSVVGRAVIGTLLVPGLGTIVGGMSGIGIKTRKGDRNFYLILNYEDAKGELAGVTFLNSLDILHLGKFVGEINTLISQEQKTISL